MSGVSGSVGRRPKFDKVFDEVGTKSVYGSTTRVNEDKRTPAELLDFIEAKGKEADAALTRLRGPVSSSVQG